MQLQHKYFYDALKKKVLQVDCCLFVTNVEKKFRPLVLISALFHLYSNHCALAS